MGYILIVEDDDVIRTTLKQFICFEGFNAQAVENGKKALEFISASTEVPELIFLDLNMPEMNGCELLYILKRDDRFKNIPVVIVTASLLDNVRPIVADAFLEKPINLNELLRLCLQWCGQPQVYQAPVL